MLKPQVTETPTKSYRYQNKFLFPICLSCIFTVLLVVLRSSDQRLALVEDFTKRLSLLTDTEDIVLNFVATNHGGQSETQSHSVHKEVEGKMSKSKS